MNLHQKLLTGFAAVATLVLITGGLGMALVSRVSQTTEVVVNETLETAERVSRAVMLTERTIALSREYAGRLDGLDALEGRIEATMTDFESTVAGISEPELAELTAGAAAENAAFQQSVRDLLAAHRARAAFEFNFEGLDYDLKSFSYFIDSRLNDWATQLEEAVKFGASFSGNMDVAKSDYERWYPSFRTDDADLQQLLNKYRKLNAKIHGFARKVENATGKRKESHFARGKARTLFKAKGVLRDIQAYVAPRVDEAGRAERVAQANIEQAARRTQAALGRLSETVAVDVAAARLKVTETRSLAELLFLGVMTFSVAAALGGGFYMARSISTPITRLAAVMRSVTETGNFSLRTEVMGNDEVATSARALNALLENLQTAIGETGDVMAAVAKGDFSRRMKEADFSGDLRTLRDRVKESAESVEITMRALGEVMDALATGNFKKRMQNTVQGEFRDKVDNAMAIMEGAIHEIGAVMEAVSRGDFDQRVESELPGELAALKRSTNQSLSALQAAIDEITEAASAQMQGDLTRTVEGDYQGRLGELTGALSRATSTLTAIVGDVRDVAGQITTGAGDVARGNADMSLRSESQASNLQETAASMEEMTSSVKSNAEHADQANRLVTEARSRAEEGGAVVREAVAAMQPIIDSSRQIAGIVELIDGIAFQTNLLALNASVEAARAGDEGRGFAVVASEVRELAKRSSDAAGQIKTIIDQNAAKIDEGSRQVKKSGESLEAIVDAVGSVAANVGQIAHASREQEAGIEQTTRAITRLEEINQQNVAVARQIAGSSGSMDALAKQLVGLMGHFTVEPGADGCTIAAPPEAGVVIARADTACSSMQTDLSPGPNPLPRGDGAVDAPHDRRAAHG